MNVTLYRFLQVECSIHWFDRLGGIDWRGARDWRVSLLRRICRIVPAGQESTFSGFDAELAELLSQVCHQAVPGAGMTGGTMASIRCGPGSA